MKKRNKMKIFGNALIALSFFSMIGIYFPIIRGYMFPYAVKIPPDTPAIHIDAIDAHAPLVLDVDPWRKEVYQDALTHGVAHAAPSALPGESGTVYLFAHSSDAPWRLTRYNTVFLRLHELSEGDTIELIYDNTSYRYSVHDMKTVWPNDTQYLTNLDTNQLILQTCAPIGTDLMRLLVFAHPLSSS